jgi:hypothetical protein
MYKFSTADDAGGVMHEYVRGTGQYKEHDDDEDGMKNRVVSGAGTKNKYVHKSGNDDDGGGGGGGDFDELSVRSSASVAPSAAPSAFGYSHSSLASTAQTNASTATRSQKGGGSSSGGGRGRGRGGKRGGGRRRSGSSARSTSSKASTATNATDASGSGRSGRVQTSTDTANWSHSAQAYARFKG